MATNVNAHVELTFPINFLWGKIENCNNFFKKCFMMKQLRICDG